MGRHNRQGVWIPQPAWLDDPERGDFDDAIDAEEAGLDEPRCDMCGAPSLGICVDCEYEQQDRHLEQQFEDRVNGGFDEGDYQQINEPDPWEDLIGAEYCAMPALAPNVNQKPDVVSIGRAKVNQQVSREEKVQALQETVDSAIEKLAEQLAEGHTQSFLDTRAFYAKLHRYSWANQILIRVQRPDASMVAGYGRWQELKRQVKKGARGIAIYAPILRKAVDAESGEEVGLLTGYRIVHVFAAEDLIDIETNPLPSIWPVLPDDCQPIWERFVDRLNKEGMTVTERKLPANTQGVCRGKQIIVQQGLDSRSRLHVGMHEAAHYYAHLGQAGDKQLKEIEAELASHAVAFHLGLDHPSARDYLLNWKATPDQLRASLSAVQRIVAKLVPLVEE